MRLIYPASPLHPREPDEQYAEEFNAAKRMGFELTLFSFEQFTTGTFRPFPIFTPAEPVLYRGWMMTPSDYSRFHAGVSDSGAVPLTSPQQYELCHYLPRWYSTLKEFTPETHFFAESDDIAEQLRGLSWQGCFLKDYVKSLAVEGGSMVSDLSSIPAVIAKMKKYRGEIEGGICARRIKDFEPDTEDRYFVYQGRAFSRAGPVPEVVEIAARRISSPFFTVDSVRRRDGTLRIVELGDGQVSDRKQWTPENLLKILFV